MRIPIYTNRIGIPPVHIERSESEAEIVSVAKLLWDMVWNGPTDGDGGFWLEPQACELWGIYVGMLRRVWALEDELFEAQLALIHDEDDVPDGEGENMTEDFEVDVPVEDEVEVVESEPEEAEVEPEPEQPWWERETGLQAIEARIEHLGGDDAKGSESRARIAEDRSVKYMVEVGYSLDEALDTERQNLLDMSDVEFAHSRISTRLHELSVLREKLLP